MRFVLQQSTDPDYFQALLSCISLFFSRLMQFFTQMPPVCFCLRVSPPEMLSKLGNPRHKLECDTSLLARKYAIQLTTENNRNPQVKK